RSLVTSALPRFTACGIALSSNPSTFHCRSRPPCLIPFAVAFLPLSSPSHDIDQLIPHHNLLHHALGGDELRDARVRHSAPVQFQPARSEEHTSELQSR